MRAFLIVIVMLVSFSVSAQQRDTAAKYDDAILSNNEADYLNTYLQKKRGTFDFKNKRIAFVTGPGGKTIGSRSDYFESVKAWNLYKKGNVATDIIILKEKERAATTYDAVVTYWVKIPTTAVARKELLRTISEGKIK